VTGVVLLNLLFYALAGWSLLQMRAQYQRKAEITTSNLARVLDTSIAGSLDRTNVSLVAVVGLLEQQLADGRLDEPRLQAYLAAQRRYLAQSYELYVTDSQGRIFGSGSSQNAAVSVADREYFLRSRAAPTADPVIGKPVPSRIDGKWVLPVARRYSFPDGRFAGIVVSPIPLDYFVTTFSTLDIGTHGSISLRDDRLAIIARYPQQGTLSAAGQLNLLPSTIELVKKQPECGTFQATLRADRVERVVSYRKIGRYPLYIFVGVATADSLGNWHSEAGRVLVLVLAFTLFSAFMARQSSHRWTSERRATEALAESERTARAMLNSSFGLIGLMKPDGTMIEVNQTALDFVGARRSEVEGRAFWETSWFTHSQELRDRLREAVRQGVRGEFIRFEIIIPDAAGTMHTLDFSLRPVPDEKGKIGLLIAEGRDISERKQMEESLRVEKEFNQTLVQLSPAFFVAIGADGKTILMNDTMLRALGYRAEEVEGLDYVATFVPEEDREELNRVLKRIVEERESPTHVNRVRAKDGRLVVCEWHGIPVFRGDRYNFFLGVGIDITERRQAEEELDHYRHNLEELVELRTAELSEARDAAEAATRAKSEFLANMTHELRTPMNAVIGMIHLVQQSELPPREGEYLSKARLAADSLLGIINDILDFSKIEAGKLEFEQRPFLLDDVLDKVIAFTGLKAREKGLEFLMKVAPEVPLCLVGDPLRLGQVLNNLCNNAVKFTEKGEIVLSALRHAEAPDGGLTLRFSVRDTGIGIAAEDLPRLFTPFTQVDSSSTRRFGGTGLGLTISKRLVQLMGGEIWVASEPGRGSEFSFTVKVGAGPPEPARVPQLTADLKGLRVLVVDHSAQAREILAELLASLGFQVSQAASSAEALSRFGQHPESPFELVFWDGNLPDRDGLETARPIGRSASRPPLPKVIMMTAYGAAEPSAKGARERFDGYLSKPLTMSSLLAAVLRAFGKGPPAAAREPAGPDLEELRAVLGGARVLLVEDNEFNQQVAGELLRSVGIEVTVAGNGAEALRMLKAASFDAVLMDVQMPVMDGYQATRLIRCQPDFTGLPIIALTAHALETDRRRCLESGMNDFVSKPFEPRELYSVLGKWIRPAQGAGAAPSAAAPRQSGVQAAAEQPVISVETGLRRCSSWEFYLKMLNSFLATKSTTAEAIGAELVKGDRDSASRIAHSMKSVAGTIGALELSTAASVLDHAISDRDPKVPLLLTQFKRELDRAIAGVQAIVGGAQPLETGAEKEREKLLDTAGLRGLIHEIVENLDSDVGLALSQLETLGKQLAGTRFAWAYEKVKRQMDVFDIEKAKASLAKLLESLAATDKRE